MYVGVCARARIACLLCRPPSTLVLFLACHLSASTADCIIDETRDNTQKRTHFRLF